MNLRIALDMVGGCRSASTCQRSVGRLDVNGNRIEQSHFRLRRVAALIVVAGVAVSSGGASSGNSSERRAWRRPIGTLGSGFFDPAAPPPPEGMIRPRAGSWDAVHPPRGYRVVLLTAGDDPATTTLVRAVKRWATAEHVWLHTVAVTEPADSVDGIVEAIDLRPDLVISAGHALVDALALVTASHLDQQFLVVGAQLPEPTVNVTAAVWRGASSRGGEVPDTVSSFDLDAFTHEHARTAIRAGVASVLSDLTGIVIWLD
jgi:hypothetical protein